MFVFQTYVAINFKAVLSNGKIKINDQFEIVNSFQFAQHPAAPYSCVRVSSQSAHFLGKDINFASQSANFLSLVRRSISPANQLTSLVRRSISPTNQLISLVRRSISPANQLT
jgi:hypothetical protein